MDKNLKHNIDGENILARHYVGMGRDAGVRQMVKDNLAKGKDVNEKAKWASAAWDKLKKAVDEDDKPKEQVVDKNDVSQLKDEEIPVFPSEVEDKVKEEKEEEPF